MEKTEHTLTPQLAPIPLPEQCCAHCASGFETLIPTQIGLKMYQCRALPPTPMLVPGPNGQLMVQSQFPVCPASLSCGMFTVRKPGPG